MDAEKAPPGMSEKEIMAKMDAIRKGWDGKGIMVMGDDGKMRIVNKLKSEETQKRTSTYRDVFSLIMGAAYVGIGAAYKDDCNFEVPRYLMVAGGLMIAISVLSEIAWQTPCKLDDKIMSAIGPLYSIAQFCILIWGSVIVFGNYGEWVYDEDMNEADEYCRYTPFLFAFIMLILYWVAFPIILCCGCMMLCTGCGILAMIGLAEAMDDEQK